LDHSLLLYNTAKVPLPFIEKICKQTQH